MASSSFSPSRSNSLRSRRHATSLDGGPFGLGAGAGTAALLLALVLLLVATLVAPEQPGSLETICQRHNGAEACRVW
jgi:hypothetical protein